MIILGAQASRLSFWASSATIHDCAGHHESPQSSPAFKVEDSRWSGRYKYTLLSLSHIVFFHQAINSLPQSTKPKHHIFKAFQLQSNLTNQPNQPPPKHNGLSNVPPIFHPLYQPLQRLYLL